MSGAPPFATITGSTHQRHHRRPFRQHGRDGVDHPGIVQHAGLDGVGADIVEHDFDLLADEIAGAIGRTPWTPSVFCAVSAVIAVAAKASSIVTVLMSAWMPAPPPEIGAGDDEDAALH